MKDVNNTKTQLIIELEEMRKRIAELESGIGHHEPPESGKEAQRNSILSPEDDTGDMELVNIIDNSAIQSLMDSFNEFAHIPMAIVDLKGKVLAGPGWGNICKRFHRVHPDTGRNCIDSDTVLSTGVSAGEYKLYKCKNNMWDIASPIIVGGRHVGNVISGQFFFDDEQLDYELFRSQARKYGFPEEEYISALEEVPRFSRKSMDAGMAFLMKLAQMISQLSYSNIKLARSLVEREALMTSLQAAEEKYRGIFVNALEGIYRTTPSGRLLEANPALAHIFGYDSPEELMIKVTNVGTQLHVDPEGREQFISIMDRQDYARHEAQMLKKNGSTCWVCFSGRAVRNADGETIYYEGFAEDITERKQIEAELKQYGDHLEKLVKERTGQLIESENKYRTIFENTGNATLIYDEDTKISLVNSEFERLFGYTRDEVEGKKRWTDLTLPEDFERLREYHRLRGIDPDAVPRNYELKVVDRSGHIHDAYMTIAMIPGTNKRVASLMDISHLKETERALRESKMHYQALFDHAGVAIAELDAQGKHLSFNASLVEFTGYTREELNGMTSSDITHPDYIEETQNLRTKQVNGEIDQFTIEKCYIHKAGTLRWGELNSTPIRDEQGKFLSTVMYITDITERKKVEEELSIKEALYRNLFENAPIGMFQTTFEEGRFLRVNSAYAKMLGYESPEDLMSTIDDVATLHVNPEDRAVLLATLKQQDWYYGEYHRFRKDGSIMIGKVAIRRVLNQNGKIDFIEGIVEDVTERKRAEEELKRYAEEVRDLYENAPCGYHSLGVDGTILRMNETELSWLGYSRDEVIGKMKYDDLLTTEGMETFQHSFPIFKKQGWIRNLEFSFVRKDGGVFPILLNATAIYDENGNYLMSRSSVFDNTERRKAEETLAENEALYRNLFENASIGMFQTTLEGKFLRINKAYATMLGYESTEEVISTITDTATQIHVDPGNRAELLATLEHQDWFYAEQPYFRKDGSIMIGNLAVRKVDKQDGTTAYLEGIVEDITERKHAEEALIKSERELRIRAQNLMEVNTTMKVLLNTMEKDQEELKERFLDNIKAKVLPYLDKLKKTPLNEVQKGFIKTAEAYLDDIASPFVQKLTSNYLNLTKKEIQIAALIREGKTSKEIAELLNSNKRVVDFHRENIRKKLGLNNKKGNLSILLRSFS